MKRTRIKPLSAKQKIKNAHWNKVTNEVCEELDYICQYCGKIGQRIDRNRWDYLDGHHIIKRRYNIHTKENCYPVHRAPCHAKADVIVVEIGDYKNRELFY